MVVVEVCFASFAYSQELVVSLPAVTTAKAFASTSSRTTSKTEFGIITTAKCYWCRPIIVRESFCQELIEAH